MGDRRKVRDEEGKIYTHIYTEHREIQKLRPSRLERPKYEFQKTIKFLLCLRFVEVFELEKEFAKSLYRLFLKEILTKKTLIYIRYLELSYFSHIFLF